MSRHALCLLLAEINLNCSFSFHSLFYDNLHFYHRETCKYYVMELYVNDHYIHVICLKKQTLVGFDQVFNLKCIVLYFLA